MKAICSGFVSLLCGLTVVSLAAQDRSYGRSVVSTPYGIVATTWVQASQAGARILEQGGSAIVGRLQGGETTLSRVA